MIESQPHKTKEFLRKELLEKRKNISENRRLNAYNSLKEQLTSKLKEFSNVLSFSSFRDEIVTKPLNEIIAQKNALYLPRVIEDDLEICKIIHFDLDLKLSSKGILEPSSKVVALKNLELIQCILIPAVGFDKLNHRIGYGKGHYDRLLAKMPNALKIGVGFTDQYYPEIFPVEAHDIALDELALF